MNFYNRTNKIAHELDLSRATSGVRYLEKKPFVRGRLRLQRFLPQRHERRGQAQKGRNPRYGQSAPDFRSATAICTPQKPFDDAPHRQEHALRHARVLNAAYADGEHASCFGWCMFDYATHKDFGSGDRICYHGVLDSFRNPKLAAAVYALKAGQNRF